MKKKIIVLFILHNFLLFPVLLSGPLLASSEKAPDFTLKDLDGNAVSLSDFHGRVVVVDFWATWCHECKVSSPELERVYRKYKDSGVVFLGISLDEGSDSIEEVKEFLKKFNITFPTLMGNSKVADAYYIKGIPTTYVLNRDHIVVARYVGSISSLGALISSQIERMK